MKTTETTATGLMEQAVTAATLRAMAIINGESARRFAEKLHVSRRDIEAVFGAETFGQMVRKQGLRPVRGGGRGSTLYYRTKTVLELAERWQHG